MQIYSGTDKDPDRGWVIQAIDASKSPAWLDLVSDDKSKAAFPAVYQLDGDDLKVCIYKRGKERPAEVASGKEADLITTKRAKE